MKTLPRGNDGFPEEATMRWVFHDPANAAEAHRRASVLKKIDAWWSAFGIRARDLDDLFHRRKEWDLVGWMSETLQSIDKSLCWEFGAGPNGGHQLVITPESAKSLRPLVATILERAPKIKDWTFFAYRQPEPVEAALGTVKARTGIDVSDMKVLVQGDDGNCIKLAYCHPRAQQDPNAFGNAAFVATESLLGEEILDKWIGGIEIAPQGQKRKALPLDRLQSTVAALIAQMQEQLPAHPCVDFPDESEWACFQLESEECDDYPGKQDIFVAVSMIPNVLASWLCGRPFYSECFSKFSETFCYLKIDGAEGLDEEKFADREAIENALNAALKQERLGCVVGGGTGRRYSYIDLALMDIPRAINEMRQVLREGNIPKRTWLLFCDCEWQDEWIGIYDDTPPPPA
jgi:hypothetical protein